MKIPTLLAGPIIRRAEAERVYIWLVTSKPFTVTAELFHIEYDQKIESSAETDTLRGGKRMYIHLVKIMPDSGTFPTDTLLGYDIYFSNENETLDLGDFNLLSSGNPHAIVYGELNYPTFFIQENTPANILYGSCRKPHGKGDDTLAEANKTIRESHLSPVTRPNALFLMGDQIYADDVADPLFHIISVNAKRIIGTNNDKLMEIDQRLKADTIQLDNIHARQYIAEHFCNFTSGNAANHLIRFGEYALMYLLTFSPSLWEEIEIPAFNEIIDNYHFMYPQENREKRLKEFNQHKNRYDDQIKELVQFIETLPDIRRVLANTPVYMLFDDHDITDDWNISREWRENVFSSPLGHQTVANGLTAYWLFQGWGNDPENISREFAEKLSHHLKIFRKESLFHEEWCDFLQYTHQWSFTAPTSPTSIFLDTRTLRQYDIEPLPVTVGNRITEEPWPPRLVSEKGWQLISEALEKSSWDEHEPLILVSPTPVYGIGIVEFVLQRYVYPLRALGLPIDYAADFEAWKYNGAGFNRFIQQIARWNPSQCIILSGDVHYAGAVKSRVELNDSSSITINQFTSSPIHNMSFSGVWGGIMKLIIWFNSLKRKNRSLYRSCDKEDNLRMNRHDPNEKKWCETIKYLSFSDGSIIKTRNNLGFISVNEGGMTNKLLQHKEDLLFS